jgi:7,8-dihydropterin-6-yl-methyl-4-(beta-D-ribofuranosyl)aminobenzene 5'-phosphate synthase
MNNQSPFSAPVVESLAIRVVVDSRYEAYLPKESHPFVTTEHVGEIPGKVMQTFAAEWGLSLHLVSFANGGRAEYLMDFGWTPEVINRNCDLMSIDPANLNGLVLSHGHLDHYGGLDGFLQRHRNAMRDDVSLYVGGEEAFAPRWMENDYLDPDGTTKEIPTWGELSRKMLHSHDVVPICCDRPYVLDGSFTTGFIERNSFEQTTSDTLIPGPDHFTENERNGKLVIDNHPEEQALCYVVRGRGLVVIVVGGFHLAASKLDYINHTVDALADLDPDVVIPMHCTGSAFIEILRNRMPEKLVGANLGSKYTFGI